MLIKNFYGELIISQKFVLEFKSGEETEDNRERVHTGFEPNNDNLGELRFQLPPSYGGPTDNLDLNINYTPENYFIAAISGCFFTTFSVVSHNSNFRYKSLKIKSVGTMGTSTGKKMMETIEQEIELTIPSRMNKKKAKRILEITEGRCPLAKSVKTNIKNNYKINVL